ncbi:hypothetical protein L0P10_19960, partial [Eggerthella lenta]|nr:hypothetical protein [Eggerthella lenta]
MPVLLRSQVPHQHQALLQLPQHQRQPLLLQRLLLVLLTTPCQFWQCQPYAAMHVKKVLTWLRLPEPVVM